MSVTSGESEPLLDVSEPMVRRPRCLRSGTNAVQSPLRLDVWSALAVTDEDRDLIDELRVGHDPFPEGAVVSERRVVGSNYVDDAVFDTVQRSVEQDLADGSIRRAAPDEPVVISGRGSVLKSDGKQRPVHDLREVNRQLGDLPALSYQSVDTARARLQPGWYAAKLDIKKAYRWVPVSQRTSRFLAYRWPAPCSCAATWRAPVGTRRCASACPVCGWDVFVEQRLPFGLASCCEFFDRISRFTQRWWYRTRPAAHSEAFLVVYLDDFLVGGPTREIVQAEIDRLAAGISSLGFEENGDKRVPPCTRVTFLGIELDTVSMAVSIPPAKLAGLVGRLNVVERARAVSTDELASLVGVAAWCARVVFGARTFSRRLIDLLATARSSGERWVRLLPEVLLDLAWWRKFAKQLNEQPMSPLCCAHDANFFATDAALEASAAGIGGVYIAGDTVHRFSFTGPSTLWLPRVGVLRDEQRLALGIHHLELLAVLEAADRWSHLWAGKHVRVFCDNNVVVAWANKGTCRDPLALGWLRELFWLAVRWSFRLTAVRISSVQNTLADSLSRGQSARFDELLARWREKYGVGAAFRSDVFAPASPNNALSSVADL